MKFKSRQLLLQNVIQFYVEIDETRSWFDQVDEAGEVFKQMLMGNGYYTSGPVLYAYNPEVPDELVIMTTLGNKIKIVGENDSIIDFVDELNVVTNYYYRQYDTDEEIPYQQLEAQIREDGNQVKTIYHMVMEFYGETMIDLYYDVEEI
ncbi:hypothetical protein [Lactovum odontotermitis]